MRITSRTTTSNCHTCGGRRLGEARERREQPAVAERALRDVLAVHAVLKEIRAPRRGAARADLIALLPLHGPARPLGLEVAKALFGRRELLVPEPPALARAAEAQHPAADFLEHDLDARVEVDVDRMPHEQRPAEARVDEAPPWLRALLDEAVRPPHPLPRFVLYVRRHECQ